MQYIDYYNRHSNHNQRINEIESNSVGNKEDYVIAKSKFYAKMYSRIFRIYSVEENFIIDEHINKIKSQMEQAS